MFDCSGDMSTEQLRQLEEKLGKAVIEELEKEEEEISKVNASRAEAPGIVDVIWDRLDSVRHILIAVLLAYLVGVLGFHWFWILIVFYFV